MWCVVEHTNLLGAAFTGDWLWGAGDEACGLDRLRRLDPVGAEARRCGEVRGLALADLADPPGKTDAEADLEGVAMVDGVRGVVGAHGLQRKRARPGRVHADNARRQAKLALDGNRRLLACLVRQARDGRRALRLKGDAPTNQGMQAPADDPHDRPSMAIPGPHNGAHIAGLAVHGNRLLVGPARGRGRSA